MIKPCKGCMHFNGRYYNGPICLLHAEIVRFYDELNGECLSKTTGEVFANDMRAQGMECGPERLKYDTLWSAFWRRIFKREKDV